MSKVHEGHETVLATKLAVPPCNVGPRSMPNYASLANQAVHTLSGGERVFVGQRLEGFYVDLGADQGNYRRVVAEIERGLNLVTGLPIVRTESPGWVGVQCDDEQMALWLLRAITVENVSVRREGDVLFLPASPDFQLEKEIKNVITILAKTHHYWSEHARHELSQ